jgi:hypothetical protein
MSTYGGYSYANPNDWSKNALDKVTTALTYSAADRKWYVNDSATVQLAGTYAASVSFSVGGTVNGEAVASGTFTLDDDTFCLKVYSETPKLTVSAITPTGSNPTKVTYNATYKYGFFTGITFYASDAKTSFKNDTSATLYAVATADNDTQKHGLFTQPTLTMEVSGVGDTGTVSFVLPGGDADSITFSRTGDGKITKTLGTVRQINSWDQKILGIGYTHTLKAYYGHGTQRITTMAVVRDGISYTVTLDSSVTITNPSSENQS